MVRQDDPSEDTPLLAEEGGHVEEVEAVARINANDLNSNDATRDDSTDDRASIEAAAIGRAVDAHKGLPEVRKQLKYIVPSLGIGIFLAAIDLTLIASSAARIGSDLNSLENTQWIATGYFLATTSFQPLYGKFSDIWGRKECLIFAYAVFGLGCLWCGLSTSMASLVAARIFTGIGGGGMTTLASVVMSDIVPLRERGTWQNIINIVFASGSVAGAPLGGVLSDSIGWKWAFLGQVPLCMAAFACVGVTLRLPEREQRSNWRTKLRRLDVAGAISLITAVSFLLIGLDKGSNVAWRSPSTVAYLAAAVVSTAVFLYVELNVATEPFAPGRIVLDRNLAGAFLCNFFGFAGAFSQLFYLPIYFQAVERMTATQASLRIIPGVITGTVGSLGSGIIMQKTGKYYWLTVSVYTTLTISSVLLILFMGPAIHSGVGLSIAFSLCVLGNNSGVSTTLVGLLSTAAREDQAIVTSCSYLFRSLGISLGLAIHAAILQASLREQLASRLGSGREAARIADRIRQSIDYVKTLPPETQEAVRVSYGQTMPLVFVGISCMAFCAMVSSFFVKETKLR